MADLTTLADVKQDAVITDTKSDDQLSRLITEVSTWFLNQINRGALIEAGYVERRNGTGGDQMVPKYYPLLAVAAIAVNGTSIPASPDGVQSGFVFDDHSIYLIGSCFTKGRQNVSLSYTAGYVTVPADVERAVIDQVIFTFRRLPKLGTMQQNLQGFSAPAFSQKDMAPGVATVINAYKDRALVGL